MCEVVGDYRRIRDCFAGSKLILTSTLDVGNADGSPTVLYIQRGGQIVVNVGGFGSRYSVAQGGNVEMRSGIGDLRTQSSIRGTPV